MNKRVVGWCLISILDLLKISRGSGSFGHLEQMPYWPSYSGSKVTHIPLSGGDWLGDGLYVDNLFPRIAAEQGPGLSS